jgi:hypothetical protein
MKFARRSSGDAEEHENRKQKAQLSYAETLLQHDLICAQKRNNHQSMG